STSRARDGRPSSSPTGAASWTSNRSQRCTAGDLRSLSGALRRDTKPVSIGVYEVALPPGQSFLVGGHLELLGHRIDVSDIEVDQGVRPGIALVLREIEPDGPASHRNEPGKARLELMLPFLDEPEAPVPGDRPIPVLDIENRHHLFVHASTLDEAPGR